MNKLEVVLDEEVINIEHVQFVGLVGQLLVWLTPSVGYVSCRLSRQVVAHHNHQAIVLPTVTCRRFCNLYIQHIGSVAFIGGLITGGRVPVKTKVFFFLVFPPISSNWCQIVLGVRNLLIVTTIITLRQIPAYMEAVSQFHQSGSSKLFINLVDILSKRNGHLRCAPIRYQNLLGVLEVRSGQCAREGRAFTKFDSVDIVIVWLIDIFNNRCTTWSKCASMGGLASISRQSDNYMIEVKLISGKGQRSIRQRQTSFIIKEVAILLSSKWSRTIHCQLFCACRRVDERTITLGQINTCIAWRTTHRCCESRDSIVQRNGHRTGCRRERLTTTLATILQLTRLYHMIDKDSIGEGEQFRFVNG